MSGKNQFPNTYNFQTTSPIPTLLPMPANQTGSIPSGVVAGTMTGTTTIYSNILDVSKMDNIGLEVNWTGTPTGTIQIMASNSGVNFYALTFNPALGQPSGSAGGYTIDINQFPFKYIMIQYTNSSGTGSLTVYGQNRDLN